MTLVSVLVVGFLLGMKHATEADHLAAVATLATRRGTWIDALRQGAAWGVGHTLTLLLFGGVVLALGRSIPPRFEQGLELAVGLMLIFLGVDVLRRLRRQRIHFHAHSHGDGRMHVHAHAHLPTVATSTTPVFSQMVFVPADTDHREQPHQHPHAALVPGRALLVGMMHGMAGSAALIVLSLDAVPTVAAGVAYILVFGAGSILGMALLSAMIALPLRASARALTGLHHGMTAAVGLLSCGLGLWAVYRIVFAERLLLG
ncbi:MAG: urease accessory protein [Panacagrimonas sp.]